MTETLEPLKTYRVEFTATYQFTTSEDGHKTSVTIVSPSEHLAHGTSKKDVLRHVEKDQEIDGPLNALRILKFVKDGMWNIEPQEVAVTYHPEPIIELASPETVTQMIKDCLDES